EIDKFEHVRKPKQNAIPIAHNVRSIPLSIRDDLNQLLDKLVQEGVITTTDSSQFVSPIVLVRKKNGDICFC
ncbi:hypothetical protein NDU88_007113, partial [Pleurodeles waltl]